MFVLILEKKPSLAKNFAKKIKRNSTRVSCEVLYGASHVAVTAPDNALSLALLYSLYTEARGYGLDAHLYYARDVNPDSLPEDVRRVGEAWTRRKLRKEEVAALKNRSVTLSTA